ncbi:MAG: AAA family ATPase [Isosphaeraceae bacterium]
MQNYEQLDEQGDGIRSFVGIVVALLILNRGLFLIDEPEAFLHPPQAYRIGAFIAEQSSLSRQLSR